MQLTLEDKLELHELPGRYGDAVDDCDWGALDTIFTPEAEFEVIGLVTMRGLDEIKAFMAGPDSRHPLAHLMMNIYIEAGDDEVRLNTRAVFPVKRANKEEDGHRVHFGSYYDTVVKTDAGWRVARRVFSNKRLQR